MAARDDITLAYQTLFRWLKSYFLSTPRKLGFLNSRFLDSVRKGCNCQNKIPYTGHSIIAIHFKLLQF